MKKANSGIERRSDCPISRALDVVGDKWSLLILRDLMFTDKRSYTELQSCAEGIATNILANRLATLEQHGVIRRCTDATNARRILHFLTEKGIALLPVIMELMHWAATHLEGAVFCNEQNHAFVTNRKKLLQKITKRLEQEHLMHRV